MLAEVELLLIRSEMDIWVSSTKMLIIGLIGFSWALIIVPVGLLLEVLKEVCVRTLASRNMR